MGFLNFMKQYSGTKIKGTGSSIVQILAKWDPEGASRAEIREMDDRLNKVVEQVAKARQLYEKEQHEADVLNDLFKKRLKAAEILQQKEKLAEGDQKKQLESSLGKLIDQLEEMRSEVKQEEQEASEAKIFLEELEEVAVSAAQKLKNAKNTLDKARVEMERAKINEDRARERAERAGVIAGLDRETDELGSALAAMQAEAQKSKSRTEAYLLKSKLLDPGSEAKNDKFIAAALAEAEGGQAENASLGDRLNALRNGN